MGDKISVIVPIFRVEDYLYRCVDSIINQTYTNLEIILVDDGSPDNCPTICDEYTAKDSRIRVVHKKNGGLSDARNTGLEIATGEYISFIDSDDWIDINMYELMLNNIKKYDADIVTSNINYIYENQVNKKYNENKIVVFETEAAMKELIQDGLVQAVVWNKLYRKKLLEGILFEKGKCNEDEFFTYKILARSKKIVYSPLPLYNYRQRNTSIMGEYSLKRLDSVEALFERMNFIKENFYNLYSLEKKIFCNTCIFHYKMILNNESIDSDKKARNKLVLYRKNIEFRIKDLKVYTFKEKVAVILSGISLKYYCKLIHSK